MVSRWPWVVALLVVLAAWSVQPAPISSGEDQGSGSTSHSKKPLESQREANESVFGLSRLGEKISNLTPWRKRTPASTLPATAASPAPTAATQESFNTKQLHYPKEPKLPSSNDNHNNYNNSNGGNNQTQLGKLLSGSGGFVILFLVLLCLRRRK